MIFFVALLAIAAASKDQLVNLAANDPKLMVALFNDFVRTEGRVFETPTEARMRMRNFNDFVKMTAKWNAEDEDVDYGITTFADWTEAEYEGTLGFNSTGMPSAPAPTPIDDDDGPAPRWGSSSFKSYYGAIKNQGRTNACWAFAGTAVCEGLNGKFGSRGHLSEQETADCTSGSTIANGGFHNKALQATQSRNHLATLRDYPFRSRDGRCDYRNKRNALRFRITRVYQVRGDSGLAQALNSGPVAVGMAFDRRLSGYRGGIYTDRSCMNTRGNHAVTAIGYTSSYWEIRNSYGTTWGEYGYGRFTRGVSNMCRISEYAFGVSASSAGEEE